MLASNLKVLMQHHQQSSSSLARACGVQQPVISRLLSGETSNPKAETLAKIAQYFGIPMEQLLGHIPLTLSKSPTCHIPCLAWRDLRQYNQMPEAPLVARHIATSIPMGPQSFATDIDDSTMEPLFPFGTTVLLDPAQTPRHKDFILLITPKHVMFRQLHCSQQQRIAKPLNTLFDSHSLSADDSIAAVMMQAILQRPLAQ